MIVRDVEPRSRRVTGESEEGSLSAPGRNDATINVSGATHPLGEGSEQVQEPVLEADVAHVIAHVEEDDEGGHDIYDDIQEESVDDEEEDQLNDGDEPSAGPENELDEY